MRSQAQKDLNKLQTTQRYAARQLKLARLRGEVGERQTLEQYLESGGAITRCAPITSDPAAAIERVQKKRREEAMFPTTARNSKQVKS